MTASQLINSLTVVLSFVVSVLERLGFLNSAAAAAIQPVLTAVAGQLEPYAMGLGRWYASRFCGPAPPIDRRENETMSLFNINWRSLFGAAVATAVPDASLVGDLAGLWLAGRVGGTQAQTAAAAASPQIAPFAPAAIELVNGNVKGALVASGITGDDVDTLAANAVSNLTTHLVQGAPPAEQAVASLLSLTLGQAVGQSLANAYNHIVTGGASTTAAAKPAAA